MAPKKEDKGDDKKNDRPDPLEEKKKHAIIYEESTSEIKDDIFQLVGCLKAGEGALNRQEASFLLWHHALSSPDKHAEMINTGLVGACLSVLDMDDVSPVEKSLAAGLLTALGTTEENREPIVRGKSLANTCVGVLHNVLMRGGDLARQYAAKCLRQCAEESAARSAMLRVMDNRLVYCEFYRELLLDCKDPALLAHIGFCIRALVHERPDLVSEAIQGGLVEALLHVLRHHKVEATCCAAVCCLRELAEDRDSWARIVAANGIPLLVDLLGPPPQAVREWEMTHYREQVDPAYAAELARQRAEARQAASPSKARKEDEGEGAQPLSRSTTKLKFGDAKPSQSSQSIDLNNPTPVAPAKVRPASPPPSNPNAAAIVEKDAGKREEDERRAAAASKLPRIPDPAPGEFLSINHSALKWGSLTTMPTLAGAAGCLYNLAQKEDYCRMMSKRLAASRLCPLLDMAMHMEGEGKKKGKKKKGLQLSPEQADALTSISGCLKFLSLINANRFRMAHLRALPHLKAIYLESDKTLLRRNAQVVLSNMALLAENGSVLLEGKLPEEFLVPVPLRLTQEERAQLAMEFPEHAERLADAPQVGTVSLQEVPPKQVSNSGKK